MLNNYPISDYTVSAKNISQSGYIKFSNGLQICWQRRSATSDNNVWKSISFPRAFSSLPVVTRTIQCLSSANGWLGSLLGVVKDVSTSGCQIFVNNTSYSVYDYVIAIGIGA